MIASNFSRPAKCDITVADFDGCLFHILCEDGETIVVSLSTRCGNQVNASHLKAVYGPNLLPSPVGTNDVSISFNLNQVEKKGFLVPNPQMSSSCALLF